MPTSVAFLHTSPVHIATFSALLGSIEPTVEAEHLVDESLLKDARALGVTHPDVVKRVRQAMHRAAATGATIVVCTCSTIGGVAEDTPTAGKFVASRIDRAMADRAATLGPVVLVVAALQSTLQPTVDLLSSSANRLNRSIEIRPMLVEHAWKHFEQGDTAKYIEAVVAGVRGSLPGPNVVVLAQASMARASVLLQDVGLEVLSSPELGIRAALERLRIK